MDGGPYSNIVIGAGAVQLGDVVTVGDSRNVARVQAQFRHHGSPDSARDGVDGKLGGSLPDSTVL